MNNITSLPLILSGPLLRHVTARSVCVFVALRRSCRVTLSVYDTSAPGTDAPVAEHSAATTPLGKHLHVVAVEATLPDGRRLEPNKIYEYDLRLDYTDDSGQAASAGFGSDPVNLLVGDTPLGYEAGRLPSFAPPPDLAHLNILHGSCRKPHAGGRDMLASADQLIERSRNDPLRRPHQLLLTGDQIYADDVSVCLLKVLTEVGVALLEWPEKEKLPPPNGVTSGDDRVRPGARRGEFVKEAVGFTTSETDGHLMFLSEFYAMYLMVWSDALWPSDFGGRAGGSYTFPTARETLGDEGAEATTLKEYFDNKRLQTTQRKAEADRRRLLSFARTLPKVRRALANVPTYMIFDDHEVTDDWNLNGKWAAQTRDNLAGRRVMRNALLAYAIFQDWGNRPREYAAGTNGAKLLAEAAADGGAPSLNDAALDVLLDLSPHSRAGRAERVSWNYQTSGPQHQIITLDTRTWRDYAGPDSNDAAGLLSGAALDSQLDAFRPADPRLLTLVVSPAPVFGVPLVEAAQKVASLKDPAEYDNEPWIGNRRAFEDFLRRAAGFGTVLVLSGDVHYSFTNHTAYFREDEQPARPARLVQLCSSSLKNETSKTRLNSVVGYPRYPHRRRWLGFSRGLLAEQVEIAGATALDLTEGEPGSEPDLAAEQYLDHITRLRFLDPAVITADGWTPRARQVVRRLLYDDQGGRRAQWSYQTVFLRDGRTADERAAASGLQEGLAGYFDEQARANPALRLAPLREVQRQLMLGGERDIVGSNNLGHILFKFDAAAPSPTHAVHRLYWHLRSPAGQNIDLVTFTEHLAPLTAPAADERPEINP